LPKSDFNFSHRLRVRWAEVDRQDIVFNGHYLTYFDVAMTEYLRALGFPYPDGLLAAGSDLFVVKASVEYHAPARYDDELDIHVRVGRIGRSSLQYLFEIYRGDALLVNCENIYVNADPKTRKPAPVPQALRDAIGRFEKIDPSSAHNG
jgi:acyl-CoA thioester hydrolase